MKFSGKVWKFGDNVDTDVIIPARYLNSSDPEFLALHVMEDIDKDFSKKVKIGDIIVAGYNFGCGSSREHAPIAIKAAGVKCVIAKSFARIFFRNSFNMGLLIIESDAVDEIRPSDLLTIDTDNSMIINESTGKKWQTTKVPDFIQELIELGGLMNYAKKIEAKNV